MADMAGMAGVGVRYYDRPNGDVLANLSERRGATVLGSEVVRDWVRTIDNRWLPVTLPGRGTCLQLSHRTNYPSPCHVHVRLGRRDDFRRLGRIVAGRAVGLVLGGGGSRGLAHRGVIKAIEESGVPIDCIGGTSQGAFMGALYARHMTALRMLPALRYQCEELGTLSAMMQDITWPWVLCFFNGGAFSRMVSDCLGAAQRIEDLWIPFFCCSTNITQACPTCTAAPPTWRHVVAHMGTLCCWAPRSPDLCC